MTMRLLFIWIIFLTASLENLHAQGNWPYGNWYNISHNCLKHFGIDTNRILFDEQTFLFTETKERATSNILKSISKNNLVCFLYTDSIDKSEGDDFIQGMVVRKGRDSSYLDFILNCPDNGDIDTASVRKDFYSCDSSKFMVSRYYDRATIERFRLLRPVKDITAAELKKANDSLIRQMRSWRKKFKNTDELAWVEWIMQMDAITEMLTSMGYNPMLTAEQYESLFNLEFNI